MNYKTIGLNYINAAELEPGYIVLTMKTDQLKGVDIPLGANPRRPSKANKNVKAMIHQLETDPANFRKKNEGIAIIANEAVIDTQNKQVLFDVNTRQGVINGGHTYHTVSKHGVPEATVRVEINTGVADELTAEIAASRNASKKLSAESELNHIGTFDWIKQSLPKRMVKDICFFEGDTGSISVSDLLQVVNIISPNKGIIDNAYRSYNGKGGILGDLKRHGSNSAIVRTRKHLKDMWELYMFIRTDDQLRSRFAPVIFEGDVMYKSVAIYLLAGVLQRRVAQDDEGLVILTSSIEDIKRVLLLKADEANTEIMKLSQHFVGSVDSMVGSETFVAKMEIVFLR